MQYDSNRHHRRSIRLKGYDYSSPGAYFVTIRTQKHICFFGETLNGEMRLNAAGLMVGRVWNNLRDRFPGVITDQYIVMPDHFHGIVIINDRDWQNPMGGNMGSGEYAVGENTVGEHKGGEHKVRPCGNRGNHGNHENRGYRDNRNDNNTCCRHVNYANALHTNNRDSVCCSGSGSCKGDPCDRPYSSSSDRPYSSSSDPTLPPPHGTETGSLGRIIQAFKSITTHEYILGVKEDNWPPFPGRLWQRNYYEQIIRNQKSLDRIRQYIINNPVASQKT